MPCGRGGVCVILLDGFICAHEGGSDSSMAQSILPENSTLARQIRTAAGHGALSHAVILSGEGEFNDNGTVTTVRAGDVCFTGDGEGHSLKNLRDEPLEYVALVLYR